MNWKSGQDVGAGRTSDLRGLYTRPLWIPALQSTFNLVLFAVLASLAIAAHWWSLKVTLWPLMGFVLAGFLNAAHDCAHGTFVNSKTGNRIAGTLWCAPILVNFTIFKYKHLTHHRFTRVKGDTESLLPMTSVSDYARRMSLYNPFRAPLKTLDVAIGKLSPSA